MKRVLLLVASASVACATSGAMTAAQQGDRVALGRALGTAEKAGQLSNDEAASIAVAVADRDVRTAAGENVALERVSDARPCAHELDDALAARMTTHDAAGAQAALARLDSQALDLGDARDYLGDRDPRWRAIGARSLIRPEDAESRRRALLDPEPLVRREAARAARDAREPQDLAALVEAARVDPEPIVRTEAVRALSALPAAPNAPIANVLQDLWSGADDGLREDIALAWASPETWSAGGREALELVVAAEHGPGAVEAAAAALRHPDIQASVAQAAIGQLARAIEQGALGTRLQAIAQSPLDRPDLAAAIRHAATDDDAKVRVAALARLAEAKDPKAPEQLLILAQPGSSVAVQARFALAGAGNRAAWPWIEQDLSAQAPDQRLAAATALAEMGLAGRAAPLLADADPRVRVRAACTIIMASRRR